jgi:hypothetical protein
LDVTSEPIRDFLAPRRIAVAGVSREPNQTGNFIFRKLRDSGYEVFPVNPAAREVEGVPCHSDLASIQHAARAPRGARAVVRESPRRYRLRAVTSR